MRIDRKKLNLVVPVARGGEVLGYVHAMPISRDVFEAHYLVMAQAHTRIMARGLGTSTGPRVAKLVLLDAAREGSAEDAVRDGLLAEIRRLANWVEPGKDALPYSVALERKLLDEDDVAEVENRVCFFILVSALHLREDVPAILASAGDFWTMSTTSSSCTEYAASLRTSTADVTSLPPKAA